MVRRPLSSITELPRRVVFLEPQAQGDLTKAPFSRVGTSSNLSSAPARKKDALCLVLGNPLGPGNYPEVRLRVPVEHRQIFKQMTIGVTEVDGSSRHPTDHARLCGFRAEKRERRNILRF